MRRDTRPLVCPWIDRLKERMGIRRAVALLESARVEVPMVVGWLRPAILVPVAALSGLTAPELEAILAHELAHIRRHDYLVNLLQCVVEILMFYHPATWWITRVIRREREHCCDDMAVAACRDRLTYARALAAMEGLRVPAFSLSPAANGGNLLARVRRILKPQEESMKPVRMLLGLAVVLAVAPIWLARADDQSAKANPRSARPPMDCPQAFPNRHFADITSIGQALILGGLGDRGYLVRADVVLLHLGLDKGIASIYSCVHLHLELRRCPLRDRASLMSRLHRGITASLDACAPRFFAAPAAGTENDGFKIDSRN